MTGCANGGWTREDTYRHIALTTLKAVDYAQTMKIAREPDKYHEENPLMSKHPSETEVTLMFAGGYIAETAIAMALPTPYRSWWQYLRIGMSAACVGRNLSIGLGVGF